MERGSYSAAVNDAVQTALDVERQRVIDAAFKFGAEEGYCGQVAAALSYVYGIDAKTIRDSLGFDYVGYDAEGYTRDGWNRDTGLNRAGERHPSYHERAANYWCSDCQRFE